MKRVCVFCGSSLGNDPAFRRDTLALAAGLLRRGIGVVYGGGNIGLMGELADAMMRGGGEVIGVIPQGLVAREVGHTAVTEIRVVESMHQRKLTMSDLADGFIALPGGYGTLEEFFEMVTWVQLGIHAKPIGMLNSNGFFDPLLGFLDRVVAEGFIRPENRGLFTVAPNAEQLIDGMECHRLPAIPKWLAKAES